MLVTRKLYLYIVTALFAGWALYCFNPFQLYFQNDDFTNILLSSKHVLFQRNSFRPVCDLSIMFDYALWGTNAIGYHFTNLVLHIICSLLVYLFSKKMFASYYPVQKKSGWAFVAALLFFIYPLHSEAVFWILGRSGTLGAIFSLLFLLFFIKEKYNRVDIFCWIICYILALFTYESCWVLPLVSMVLLAGTPGGGWAILKSRKYHFITLAIIFLVYLLLRWKTNNEILDDYEAHNFLQFNITTLAQNYFQLFARSFIAYRETQLTVTITFCLLFVILFYSFFKKIKYNKAKPVYMLAGFLLSLLPYLSLGIDTHGTEGERFLYLPSIFVCLFIVMVLADMPNKLASTITVIFCLVYAAQLYINAGNYRFAGSIVKQTVEELKADSTKNIIIEQLPRAQYGAMILESGLPHAMELLNLHKSNNSIQVLSQRSEIKPLRKPYKTIYMPPSGNSSAVRYVFTDTALVVYR